MREAEDRLHLLAKAAQYDLAQTAAPAVGTLSPSIAGRITRVSRRDGCRVPLLKVLQSNLCEKDCAYCANRAYRDIHRERLSPDELARQFIGLSDHGQVSGLFLSSGIDRGTDRASDRMIATVELLRQRYNYRGYVHLKILPGSDLGCIERSLQLADRVSVNLEAANPSRMDALSRTKDYLALRKLLVEANDIRRYAGHHVGIATQFVVGAAGESDAEILRSSSELYQSVGLTRTFYSNFAPIPDTPLENHPLSPSWREHRLYQADALLRDYGFCFDDIPFDDAGNLSPAMDPKLVWARNHPEAFPLEVNTAPKEKLLRVPGIGPKSAALIVSRRRAGKLRDIGHLGLPSASVHRVESFILLDGRQPNHQLRLPL